MEAMVQNLMTDSVNLTHIITKRSLFAEIFFVFTFPNKGNSLSVFLYCDIFLGDSFVYFYFLFFCLYVLCEAQKNIQNNVQTRLFLLNDTQVSKSISCVCALGAALFCWNSKEVLIDSGFPCFGVFNLIQIGQLCMSLPFALLKPENIYFKLKNLNASLENTD